VVCCSSGGRPMSLATPGSFLALRHIRPPPDGRSRASRRAAPAGSPRSAGPWGGRVGEGWGVGTGSGSRHDPMTGSPSVWIRQCIKQSSWRTQDGLRPSKWPQRKEPQAGGSFDLQRRAPRAPVVPGRRPQEAEEAEEVLQAAGYGGACGARHVGYAVVWGRWLGTVVGDGGWGRWLGTA
jgi:hypothetical protein